MAYAEACPAFSSLVARFVGGWRIAELGLLLLGGSGQLLHFRSELYLFFLSNLRRDVVHTVHTMCTPVVYIHTHGSVHFYDPEVLCRNYSIQIVAFF